MAEFSNITINEINEAAGEAMALVPGEQTIALVTVIRGWVELASMNPDNRSYIPKLFDAVFRLSEFMMERGRHNIARRLLLLGDDLRKNWKR
jgi:hypothetical protein